MIKNNKYNLFNLSSLCYLSSHLVIVYRINNNWYKLKLHEEKLNYLMV